MAEQQTASESQRNHSQNLLDLGGGITRFAALATSRRTALIGLCAFTANAYPAARAHAQTFPALEALIAEHERAGAHFSDVSGCTDEVDLGRKATKEEHDMWDAAYEAEDAAVRAIVEHRCGSLAEISRKASYLNGIDAELVDDYIHELLASMILPSKARPAVPAV